MASAFITFLAVVYGYLSRSLPEEYYNELDSHLLTLFEKFLQHLPRLPRIRIPKWKRNHHHEYQEVKLALKPPDNDQIQKAKEERDDMKVESLQRFILALSDQQLITGFAILTAGILKSCTISWWEFQIVVSLAWFSSTTHLSTLVVLREYLQDHPAVRNWRVGGMLAILVLLFFGVLTRIALLDDYQITAQMECVFITMSAGLKYDHEFTVPIVLVFLSFAYANQLVKLFSEDRQNTIFKVLERTVTIQLIRLITGISRKEW